jgi:TolB-like protein
MGSRNLSWGGRSRGIRTFWMVAFLLGAVLAVHAQSPSVAVLDFTVNSEDPAYTHLGKGFAEFIAVELADTYGVTIIDRERRNDVLEEIEFAVSDLAADTERIRLGEMLAARYLVSGEIFDLFGELQVTVSLTDVESGATAASKRVDGAPRDYRRLIGELSAGLAGELGAAAPAVAVSEPVVEIAEEDAKTVLASFSDAVDAVDRDDPRAARANLERAAEIDRDNAAVAYYLSKLFSASPKFNVELIFYAPSYNPATLGFVTKDRFYLTQSINNPGVFHVTYPNLDPADGHVNFHWEVYDGLYYKLNLMKQELGYYLPLGSVGGVGVEVSAGATDHLVRDENYSIYGWEENDNMYIRSGAWILGGRLSGGARVAERLAVGASGYVFVNEMNLGGSDGPEDPSSVTVSGSATLGAHARLMNNQLTTGVAVTVPFLQEVYIDTNIDTYVAYQTAPYPIVYDVNAVLAAGGGRFFLSLKEVLEQYVSFGEDNRTGIASRLIPAVEWWPRDRFSVRAGGEYDLVSIMDTTQHGFGALAGFTLRLGAFDIDLNGTFMERSLRFYPGETVPDVSLLLQVSWNGALVEERP